nr:anti-sigma factor [Allopusillimonas soli]
MSSTSPLPPSSRSMLGSVWLWRVTTLVFAAIALALALLPSQPAKPPINVVKVAPTRAAILQAPGQSSTPGWIVTFDPQGNVRMAPQVHSDVPADSSVQLWTHNETLPQPRSLGLIDPNEPVTIPANLMGQPGKSQFFEMTLEPQGGSASPSGPVLFIGRVVTFGQAAQADAAATPPTSQPAS